MGDPRNPKRAEEAWNAERLRISEAELRALAPRAAAAAQRRVEALVAAARRIDPSVDLSAKGRAA